MLTLEARALGQKEPIVPEWSAPLPPELDGAPSIPLRDLIAAVVRTEVRAFEQRQREGRLLRVLTPDQVREGAARGKIDSGGRDLHQPVDEDAAVATALQAFEDGLYLVLVDDAEVRELEAPVRLRPDSRLLFLRLSLLAGG
jgi:hypothetical protein